MSFTPDWIEKMAALGRSVFTLQDAAKAAGVSDEAAAAALRRATRSGVLFSPARGVWVIVPIEYQLEGAPPWRFFLAPLLRREGRSYYLGLLSAAAELGASGQSVQEVQVVVDRQRATIKAGRQRIVFITRHNAAAAPVQELNSPVGRVPMSTPDMTALDLVSFPRHAGGMGNVVTVLTDLAGLLTARGMERVLRMGPATSSVQRLGYLLERQGREATARPLGAWLRRRATTFVPLDPRAPREGYRDTRWRVIANVPLEPD